MREILFKAKRIDNGEWVEGWIVPTMHNTYHDGYRIINVCGINYDELDGWEPTFISWEVDKDTICQYTGLTDKNGNKIWENDIVEFIGHKGKIVFGCGSFGIAYQNTIEWDEIQRRILLVTGCDNLLWACKNDNYISLWEIMWNFNDEEDSVNTVETIGNIFDNTELIKECD